jgi:hypothetical protein
MHAVQRYDELGATQPVRDVGARFPLREVIGACEMCVIWRDGLIERRNESLDQGLERLRRTVTAAPPEVVCQQVMAALIGAREPQDDIAILALRRSADA